LWDIVNWPDVVARLTAAQGCGGGTTALALEVHLAGLQELHDRRAEVLAMAEQDAAPPWNEGPSGIAALGVRLDADARRSGSRGALA
jgi:hypothetical protein